jgi:hypothetical protein
MDEARDRLRRVYKHVGMNYAEVFRWIGQVAELDKRTAAHGGAPSIWSRAGPGQGRAGAHRAHGELGFGWLWAARRYPLTIISKRSAPAGG